MSTNILTWVAQSIIPVLSVTAFAAAPNASIIDERALIKQQHAAQIDAYFKERDMPLAGYGAKMVAAAEKNGLDWRLLPAIAIRESSGGKKACDHNSFGWASCRVDFKDIDESIEVVARNLGGNNPKTAGYYKGDTRSKLQSYNGTVVPGYPDEVLRFMEKIEKDAD
jgi:hypothetical protein